MSRQQTWRRRETDKMLSISIMKKVHPSKLRAMHSESARLGPVPGERHLPSTHVDKARITLPRCYGTGSGSWRKNDGE